MTTCLQHILSLHEVCHFQAKSGSRVGPASKSEIRRWFQDSCIRINFKIVKAEDELPGYLVDIVMFPKNEAKRTTLLHENITFIQVDEDEKVTACP